MSRAIVFPGQGSQIVGMAKDFFENFSETSDLFKKANDVLNYDLGEVCFMVLRKSLIYQILLN